MRSAEGLVQINLPQGCLGRRLAALSSFWEGRGGGRGGRTAQGRHSRNQLRRHMGADPPNPAAALRGPEAGGAYGRSGGSRAEAKRTNAACERCAHKDSFEVPLQVAGGPAPTPCLPPALPNVTTPGAQRAMQPTPLHARPLSQLQDHSQPLSDRPPGTRGCLHVPGPKDALSVLP